MKKLLVIFPGVGYGLDSPLLYFTDFLFETNGFERIHMDYQDILLDRSLSHEIKLDKVREYIRNQVKNVDFSLYDEVVFVSKSIGAIEAGLLAQRIGTKVKQIFITPVKDAIAYCTSDSYVVIGTEDEAYQVYKEFCDAHKIKVMYVDDANHSLEIAQNPYKSIDILKSVMQFIER